MYTNAQVASAAFLISEIMRLRKFLPDASKYKVPNVWKTELGHLACVAANIAGAEHEDGNWRRFVKKVITASNKLVKRV